MKNTFSLFLGIALFAISALNLHASKDSLRLMGSVYNNRDVVKNATIKIYQRNQLIKEVDVKSNNRFVTNLPLNAFITIAITAPNFHTKSFIIDTTVPTELNRVPDYKFDMDIFSEEELSGVNTSVLDFPIGIVSYHPKKKEFLRNKEYTKKMKKRYLDLLEEAQMSERAAMKEQE